MMDETTFMSASTAIRLGFADGELFSDNAQPPDVSNLMRSAYRVSEVVDCVSKLDTTALRNALQEKPKTDAMRAAQLRLARARR